MGPHDEQIQRMHWQLKEFERLRVPHRAMVPMMRDIAQRYEDAANDRFQGGDVLAWSDTFAALTWWARAGERAHAERVVRVARERAAQLPEGRDETLAEIDRLRAWMHGLSVVPSLTSFAAIGRPPPPGKLAA